MVLNFKEAPSYKNNAAHILVKMWAANVQTI